MQTSAKVKVVGKPTMREMVVECPACKYSNFETVGADLPAQKGTLECRGCGATLKYEENL